MTKPLTAFLDYRRFLEHYCQEQARAPQGFSLRGFARLAGIGSTSHLKSVLDGKLGLTTAMIAKVCAAMGMDARDTKYFSHLAGFNQARTAREKQDHYAVLRALGNPVPEEQIRGRGCDYFEKWQTPIIREIVTLRDFGDDWTALGEAVHPSISPLDARIAVETLLELGLIEKLADGRYRQTKKGLVADASRTSMSVRAFHGHMLEHAKRALHELGRDERNQSSLIIGLSPTAYGSVVEEIRAFKDRVKAIVHGDADSSRVYQFSLDLFPVSRELPARTHPD